MSLRPLLRILALALAVGALVFVLVHWVDQNKRGERRSASAD